MPYGLTINTTLERKAEDKPIIYTFTYRLNQELFKKWLEDNAYLCEGPLSFVAKGIEILVPWGVDKYDKSGFSIDDKADERIWLELLEKEIVFKVHRDIFSQREWECFILD